MKTRVCLKYLLNDCLFRLCYLLGVDCRNTDLFNNFGN